ncbi:MAG: hypothetical protein Q9228_001788 [Teloschistes exilis]
MLANTAVTLRIRSDSQEADFLAAYCQILEIPALIAIHNGRLVAHLRAGTEFEEMEHTLSLTLSQDIAHTSSSSTTRSTVSVDDTNGRRSEFRHAPESLNHEQQPRPAAESENTHGVDPVSAAGPSLQDSGPIPSPSIMQQMMEERRRRLEIDKATKEAAETEKRKSIAQARREAAGTTSVTTVSKQSRYAQEQRKRQQEAKADKDRILREIENNKVERKEREEQRRALAKAKAVEILSPESAEASIDQIVAKNWTPDAQLRSCSLQIRLFNGATLRGRFASGQTISKDIRSWIASQRTDGDTPFTLKQILSPLPNRTITISEEQESLQCLGLLPSATLVMVPINGYVGAYNSHPGILSKAMAAGYNTAWAGGEMFRDVMETFLGFGRAASNDQDSVAEEQRQQGPSIKARTASVEGPKFRTLRRHGDADDDHHLYNGNQVLYGLTYSVGSSTL